MKIIVWNSQDKCVADYHRLIRGCDVWGIERNGFFNGRGKWVKGFENQRV